MMDKITVAWVTIPFLLGFIIFLVPKLNRYLALLGTMASAGYGLQMLIVPTTINLTLLDSFGNSLLVDQLSGYFILTNALVTAAVIFYCWHSDRNAFFFAQTILLHGSLNAAFICQMLAHKEEFVKSTW